MAQPPVDLDVFTPAGHRAVRLSFGEGYPHRPVNGPHEAPKLVAVKPGGVTIPHHGTVRA